MHKIVYAINSKEAEDAITQRIQTDYMVASTIGYRDGIIDRLDSTGADTLLIRDTLSGNPTNMETLINNIRIRFPNVRIVMICGEKPKGDPFLKALVAMGVYDIINSDRPTISDICSYIMNPRTYRDTIQYGIGMVEPADKTDKETPKKEPVSTEQPKKGGFLGNLRSGFNSLINPGKQKPAEQEPIQETPPAPAPSEQNLSDFKINSGLIDSYKQAAVQQVNAEVEQLVAIQVEKQTSTLQKENESLQKQLASAQAEVAQLKLQCSNFEEELNQVKSERDRINENLQELHANSKATIELYESQLKSLQSNTNTPQWYIEQNNLWEQEKAKLEKDLEDKTKEASELSLRIEDLLRQIDDKSNQIVQLEAKAQYANDLKLSDKGTEELIIRLRKEATEQTAESVKLKAQIEDLQEELENIRRGGPDFSYPTVNIPMLPDDAVYNVSNSSPQIILMIGAKHGVGNTTAALNVAASLAGRGYKTALIEINTGFPLINSYFEMTHVPTGIEEYVTAISNGRIESVDPYIIRPRGMSPVQPALSKAYKKLPAGLHFMLFSNNSLANHNFENYSKATEATTWTFLSHFKRSQYSYVIVDLQCDDYRAISNFGSNTYPIDRLCITMTQDTHSIMSAGYLITVLSKAHASNLVGSGVFIVNRYNSQIPVPLQKVEKTLHVSQTQICRLSEDSNGYFSAVAAALPYIQNNGRFAMEYEDLRKKIAPGT